MLPTAYEFHWDLGHIFFLGIFYAVVTAVIVGLAVAIRHWLSDLRRQRTQAIVWAETFHDLPAERRHCRHELRGAVEHRICERGFDCGHCPTHESLLAADGSPAGGSAGLQHPEQRYYHRGHTWVEPRDDGTLAVGIDDLASRCIGRPDVVEAPAVGRELGPGDAVAVIRHGRLEARVLSPVTGEVVAVGDDQSDELCRIRPDDPDMALRPLLRGREADVWMLRELESLQGLLGDRDAAPALADGGQLVDDLVQAYPDADWDRIWGHVCLET